MGLRSPAGEVEITANSGGGANDYNTKII